MGPHPGPVFQVGQIVGQFVAEHLAQDMVEFRVSECGVDPYPRSLGTADSQSPGHPGTEGEIKWEAGGRLHSLKEGLCQRFQHACLCG